MKHSFILMCLVGSFIGTNLSAQRFITEGINKRSPEFKQTMRPWEAGPLQWDEFQGEVKSDTTINNFAWNTRLSRTSQKVGNTTYYYSKFFTYFDQTESWTAPKFKNDAMLQYNQILFDMLELYSRKATIEFNRGNTATVDLSKINTEVSKYDETESQYDNREITAEEISAFYRRQFDKRAEELKKGTRMGTDGSRLPYYAADVALDLERTHYDPQTSIEGLRTGVSGEFYVGVSTMFPRSDYYTSAYGLNLGMSAGWSRHLFTLDISVGWGSEAKKDIETKKGWILEGKHTNYFQFYGNYAFCTARTSKMQYFPFIGLGMNGFNVPKENKDDSNNVPMKNGFSACAGMMFDIIMHRTVNIRNSMMGSKADVGYYAIRLKPYFSMTHYNDLGWMPAINLNVSFNWGGYTLF